MAQFNEESLKKHIKTGEFMRVYLIYGNEGFLKQHYANEICKKSVSKDFEDFNLKKLDGKETSLNEIYDCVSSFPMMSDYTCTIIKDFHFMFNIFMLLQAITKKKIGISLLNKIKGKNYET